MNDLNLSGLLDIKLEIPEMAKRVRVATPKNPENADIRVFARGSVLPSTALVAEFDLEFKNKSEAVGNGIDVFSSNDWPMITLEKELLFVAVVSKDNPKVDLFNKITYSGDVPNSSVMVTPNATFGKNTLLDLLTSAYGIDWENVKYVDLNIARENKMESPSEKFWVPKVISRGANKGDAEILVRKSAQVFPIVVAHIEKVLDQPTVDEVVEEMVQDEDVAVASIPTPEEDALDPFTLG